MKTVVLLYNTSCIFEIVILNYFLKFRDKEVVFASLDGEAVISTEGYSLNVDRAISEIDTKDVELLIVPGGDIKEVDIKEVYEFIQKVNANHCLVSAICAGVDLLEHAGVLDEVLSTHSCESDVVSQDNIITAGANAYVDFAIEVARKMDLFDDEKDLQETIQFWKNHKSVG